MTDSRPLDLNVRRMVGAVSLRFWLPRLVDRRLLSPVLLVAAFVWCFWATMISLAREWRTDENYSIGALVLPAAVFLAWQDRTTLNRLEWRPCWWGLSLIVLGLGIRMFGLMRVLDSIERYGMIISLIGVILLVVGPQVFFRLVWLLLFLFLMVPLPGRVHNLVAGPLQILATQGALFITELLGLRVLVQGNVLIVDGESIAVAEACSGLRMLTAFVVVAYMLAYVIRCPAWQKVLLVLSSIPVAIICNLARLVVTVLLVKLVSPDFAHFFFHDLGGWAMMPLAVLILLAEQKILSLLVVAPGEKGLPVRG